MTDFSAIPSGDVDPDSPLTTGLVIKLRDNHLAQFEGAAGAPKLQSAAIDNNAVDTPALAAAAAGRSELANMTTTDAGSYSSGTRLGITLNDWALFPMIHTSTNNSVVQGHPSDGSGAGNPRFGIFDAGNAGTYDVDHRWILAA